MPRRHRKKLPTLWLLTDERQGAQLWPALDALPRGAGVIIRHYSLRRSTRAELIRRVLARASRRRLVVLIAGKSPSLHDWRVDGIHNANRPIAGRKTMATAAVHSQRELVEARRNGVAAVLISPAFATHSHPGTPPLGRWRLIRIARSAPMPVIALGGMTPQRFKSLQRHGIYGWAAIDALTPPATD